ncbi:oxygenase MpaB family protein [Smaragdicoccus niigatensis]|uniref:oxygenase MpaB family protein n=1 Tax=Smaragdicoccus niigatensis TaxID=359359 RepID=UPI00035DFF7E|nr:oxygenase MpaB family protein [Smaragdicoccus niigatensis]
MYTLRRPELWEDRTVTAAEVREIIAGLDPVADCAEITHLSLEVLTPPMFAQMAYASGFARGVTHPAEAIVTHRAGGYVNAPENRDRDTLAFFGLLYRHGPHSEEMQRVVDRIQQIHHDVRGVGNNLQLHILGLMIIEPERWARDLGAANFFTTVENDARFHLWAAIGRMMGLEGIWSSYDEVEPWVVAFESRHSRYTTEAAELYRGQIKAFEAWFPGPSKALGGQVLTAGLPKQYRSMLGAPRLLPGVTSSIRAITKVILASENARRVNLSSTWVKDFSRFGDNPDLQAMGYQHDVANDARYQRVGAPADGYTFTVARGVEAGHAPVGVCPLGHR